MKLRSFAWIPLASVSVLAGCVSSPASQFISSLPESSTGSMADLNTYNGKTHVFFTVQNKNVEIDALKNKIERSDVEALYLPNKYNEQQNIRNECMTLQNKNQRYEPCYQTLGLRHLQEKSIFVKGNVSAGGVLSSIIAAPFQVVGAAVNAVTLNGKGVADNVKGIGQGTMDYSTDTQAVQKVGRYLDDRLAQAQKNARQALANYQDENSIRQAKNIKGLLKDDEYYQAFIKAKNNEQRLAVFNIIGVINGRSDKFDNFTRMVLQSPKDLPLWAETLSATPYKPRLSLAQAKRIPNFASEANTRDFFNSHEYRYVLQYLKPEKITHSASGRRAALNVNYGHGINITLQRPANCQQTATYNSHDVAKTGGIFRLLGFGSEYNVTNRVTEYTCKASEQDIAQLQSWERQLTGNTLASSQISRSWKTTDSQEIAREKIQYAPPPSNYNSDYSSNPSPASSGSSQRLWQCTVFCGKHDVNTQVLAVDRSEAHNKATKYGREYCFKLTNQLLEARWWHGAAKCEEIK